MQPVQTKKELAEKKTQTKTPFLNDLPTRGNLKQLAAKWAFKAHLLHFPKFKGSVNKGC